MRDRLQGLRDVDSSPPRRVRMIVFHDRVAHGRITEAASLDSPWICYTSAAAGLSGDLSMAMTGSHPRTGSPPPMTSSMLGTAQRVCW